MKPILLSYVKTEPLVSSGFSVASSIRVSRKTQFQYLQEHGGYCDLGDKSDAEEIKLRFEVSKKTTRRPLATCTNATSYRLSQMASIYRKPASKN